MIPLVCDFETYYDREYSLSKITTEAYVRDPRFEVIGVAIKIGDAPTQWYPQPQVAAAIASIDWSNKMVICQNTAFDGAILAWHYHQSPLAWADTLGMSRALFPHDKSHSLAAQAKRLDIGVKGTEVDNALSKHYVDFTADALARYGAYCVNDVELTHTLFMRYLAMGFPKQELRLIDATLRMFIEPRLVLDRELLTTHLAAVKDHKQQLLEDVRDTLIGDYSDPATAQAVLADGMDGIKKLLMSNDKFAKLLEQFGVEPPMKVSPATGKLAYAFAKTDEPFKELAEHPDVRVQALVAARLGNKTTLEETRTERFIDMADRGLFPVPLRYYGAHSGRWSGQESVNLQNLPSRGPYAKALKRAIKAPPGHVVIDCDSAQIEARCLAWLAGQHDLVEAFRDKQDVYKIMASHIYGVAPDQINKEQRQVGKVTVLGCFGSDTVVLTQRGWVSIVHVRDTDKVWDGEQWVSHAGVVPQGEKDVWTYQWISATSDHEILTEHGWETWCAVIANPFLWKSALNAANLPYLNGDLTSPQGAGILGGTQFANAPAAGQASSCAKIWLKGAALGAIRALKLKRTLSVIGNTKAYVQMKLRELGCSIEFRRAYPAAIIQTTNSLHTTEDEAFSYTNRGVKTEPRFLNTLSRLKATTARHLSWIGLTWIRATNRAISALWGGPKTQQIAAASAGCNSKSQPLKQRMQTYDIAYAGPKNRYTILSATGPLVVHNCGYGVGHGKLKAFLKSMAGVEVPEAEAKRIINAYRNTYDCIPYLWDKAAQAIQALYSGQEMVVDVPGLVRVEPGRGLTLPSGLHIQYPELRREYNDAGKAEWRYTAKGLPTRVYGGLCLSGDTLVLTEVGWKRLDSISTERVHDGVEFVGHGGVSFSGYKQCVQLDGVSLTPNHEVLTDEGWKPALEKPRLYRPSIRHADRLTSFAQRRKENALGVPLPMWDDVYQSWLGSSEGNEERQNSQLRMSHIDFATGHTSNARYEQASRILGVAQYGRSLHATYASGVEKLWGAWDNCVRPLATFVRSVLGGYGFNLHAAAYAGTSGQLEGILSRELYVGNIQNAGTKPQGYVSDRHRSVVRADWNPEIDAVLSPSSRPVFDIINCGPRSRFVVLGENGPFVVHNCVENFTQAIARCVVAEQLLRIRKRYPVVLTVHDSVACIAPEPVAEQAMEYVVECMSWNPKWSTGLPLSCEAGVGSSYGDC